MAIQSTVNASDLLQPDTGFPAAGACLESSTVPRVECEVGLRGYVEAELVPEVSPSKLVANINTVSNCITITQGLQAEVASG